MSMLLRLPSLDRPTLGFSKRLSMLSSNTACSTQEDLSSSLSSLRTLPSVEHLDNADFLNMFETRPEQIRSSDDTARRPRPLPEELPSTPTRQYLSELHSTPTRLCELGPTSAQGPHRSVKTMERTDSEQSRMTYTSSLSSNPSTNLSHASSRRSRKSSVSSVTDLSSSERSAKESDKENALHERLKRRSKDRRVSSGNTPGLSGHTRLRSISDTHLAGSRSLLQAQMLEAPEVPQQSPRTWNRPSSRGKRLGKAMADGAVSPPMSPQVPTMRTERYIASPLQQVSNTKTRASRRTSSASSSTKRSSCLVLHPQVDGVDRIRVGIMSSLDSLDDLRSLSQTSRDFYATYQKYETLLVDCVLYHQSPPAWELRSSVRHPEKPSPFRMRSVQRDLSAIYALEDFIVWKCQSILRPQTLDALIGEAPRRKAELEDAIWTIWTFCNVFGKTSMSDATLLKQTQWLDGVSANKRLSSVSPAIETCRQPCTTRQLEDMSEMWRCFELLLSGFKEREAEARSAGLFDNVKETKVTDRELLNAWIYDILSLGPKAVLTLSSCDFEQARVLGITRWTPPTKGKSRSNFLKAAVEEVYRDRLMKEARQKALTYRRSVQNNHIHKRSRSDPSAFEMSHGPRPPVPLTMRHSLRLDTGQVSRQSMPPQGLPSLEQRMEIRPDCDPLSPVSSSHTPVTAASSNPGVFSPLVMTKNVSTKVGATLFPMQNRDQSHRLSIPVGSVIHEEIESDRRSMVDVIDPTDKAVALMVQDMGFSEADAKRALAMSDTGSGINIEKAVETLSTGSKLSERPRHAQVYELPASLGTARLARRASKRDMCEGHCKPMILIEPKRERVTGLGIVKRGLSSRMSFKKNPRLSVIQDEDEAAQWSTSANSRSNTISNHGSALSHLASSAMSAFSTPALPTFGTSTSVQPKDYEVSGDQSPVSPVTPMKHWLEPDTNPVSEAQAHLEEEQSMPKPRITLQRVGTGAKKWNIPGMRKKGQNAQQPEIIGYAY